MLSLVGPAGSSLMRPRRGRRAARRRAAARTLCRRCACALVIALSWVLALMLMNVAIFRFYIED